MPAPRVDRAKAWRTAEGLDLRFFGGEVKLVGGPIERTFPLAEAGDAFPF